MEPGDLAAEEDSTLGKQRSTVLKKGKIRRACCAEDRYEQARGKS